MIVRALSLVHFRGVRELRSGAVAERGVVEMPVPAGADPALVAAALRFAFLGAGDAASVVSQGTGHAFVEAAFSTAAGERASVFRGVDRRGTVQVSLREETGPRVTGGEAEVRARLEELLGAPLSVWERATFLDGAGADPAPQAAPPGREPRPALASEPAAAPAPEVAALRERAEAAVDRLRRALRADVLGQRMEADFAALLDAGGRLRGERTDAAVAADRAIAERDRLRARVRRVGEYRELVAQERAAAERREAARPAEVRETRWAEATAALCAALLLMVLVYVRAAVPESHAFAIVLGVAFLSSAVCYVAVASAAGSGRSAGRRLRDAPRRAGEEWREALRHRFAELGDPDDPKLLDDLRARLAPIEAEVAPLQARLENLDEAIAAFDVEAGCASKVAHREASHPETAARLAPGDTVADARSRIAKLGDAVHHAAVERDALAAGGVEAAGAAAAAVREALRRLGDAAGDPSGASSALERAGLGAATPAATAVPTRDPDVCARLVEEVAALGRRGRRALPSAPPAAPPTAAAPPDVATLLAGHVERITGRSFVYVQDGKGLELRFQGPDDPRPVGWAGLPPGVRERLEFALRLRLAETALGDADARAPRFVVLADRPPGLDADAALAEFVAALAASVTQVLVAPAPLPAPSTGDVAERSAVAPPPASGPRRMTSH